VRHLNSFRNTVTCRVHRLRRAAGRLQIAKIGGYPAGPDMEPGKGSDRMSHNLDASGNTARVVARPSAAILARTHTRGQLRRRPVVTGGLSGAPNGRPTRGRKGRDLAACDGARSRQRHLAGGSVHKCRSGYSAVMQPTQTPPASRRLTNLMQFSPHSAGTSHSACRS
jgi:hypothetical protein